MAIDASWKKSKLVKKLNDWTSSETITTTVYGRGVAESVAYVEMVERKFSNEHMARAAGYQPQPDSAALASIGLTWRNRAVAALLAGDAAGWDQLALSVAYEVAADRLQMRIFKRVRLLTTGIQALRCALTLASAIAVGDKAFCRSYVEFLTQVEQLSAFMKIDARLHDWLLPFAARAFGIDVAEPAGIPSEYARVSAVWDTTDLDALSAALLALADRHTAQARTSGSKATYDFDDLAYAVFPGEILAVLRLRQWRGLDNPALDHPLLQGLFSALPAPRDIQPDELLAAVIAKADRIYPDKN